MIRLEALGVGFVAWQGLAGTPLTANLVTRSRGQVTIYDMRYVRERYAGVPDVVGEDEDDGALFVAAGAGVAQDRGRREAAALDLVPESLQ